ncbi:MAG: SAF domain-containing protein [Marmoricola sp.]
MPIPWPTSRRPFRALGGLRRRVLLHRRLLAALLAALAVLLGVRELQAPAPPTTSAWTAARDLSTGMVLSRADLARVPFAPGSVPDHAVTSPGSVLGRIVAAPLRRGEPITDLQVVAPPLLSAYPGRVATPVRIADPAVVDLLRVGDVVNLVAADPQGETPARIVAAAVTVIAIPPNNAAQLDPGLSGRLVLFAVPAERATEVSAAGVSGFLTLTLSR